MSSTVMMPQHFFLIVDHGQGEQIVAGHERRRFHVVGIGTDALDTLVHELGETRFRSMAEQVVDRQGAQEPLLLVQHVNDVYVFDLGAGPADEVQGFGHGQVRLDGQKIGGHQAAGRVFLVLQQLLDVLGLLVLHLADDGLGFFLGQVAQDVGGVIRGHGIHDIGGLALVQPFHEVLLVLFVHFGNGLGHGVDAQGIDQRLLVVRGDLGQQVGDLVGMQGLHFRLETVRERWVISSPSAWM